jgi:hypothetical protein
MEQERGGENINKAKELAAERTKYCSLVTLETPCIRKQAPGATVFVSIMKERTKKKWLLYMQRLDYFM